MDSSMEAQERVAKCLEVFVPTQEPRYSHARRSAIARDLEQIHLSADHGGAPIEISNGKCTSTTYHSIVLGL